MALFLILCYNYYRGVLIMARILILFILAILPVYFIGLYIYIKDKDKESKKLLLKLFVFGIIACIPTLIFELLIGSFFGLEENMTYNSLFIYVFISVALVEEICKWFFIYKLSYNNFEFDHIYDAIVYSVFLALGFATLENIFYIFDGGITIALLRAVSAVPGHACFAVIMGYYLGIAKTSSFIGNSNNTEKKNLLLSIFVPTVIHTLYDFCLMTGNILFIILFCVILMFMYIYSIRTVKKISSVKNNFLDNLK